MEREPGPEVFAENDCHIDAAERIGHDAYPAATQCGGDSAGAVRISSACQHLSQRRKRIGIAQEYHVEPLAAEKPGCRTRRALATSAVEHLHLHPLGGAYRRWGRGRPCPLISSEQQKSGAADQQGGAAQRKGAPVPARLFQNRVVGSSMGHPDSMV